MYLLRARLIICLHAAGAFLAAEVWGGHCQRGGHVCIGGGGKIPDDVTHDGVSGVI